ncbi:YcdB/YcdC domain-containing protein [Paenibacillus yonginensis]|uniref:YcdB/YcdC domain-containing protein n=1 Tax=Paenibacillus yonginensis TaxID=1462996 RepID=UPI001471C76D|nr:S-layer homology domain-containing protein [Paenibacillus yonginensis]
MKRNPQAGEAKAAKMTISALTALLLLTPAAMAGAEEAGSVDTAISSTASPAGNRGLQQAAGELTANASSQPSKADPSKVKFTKDQAVAKLRELFPILSEATVSSYELGVTNQYPPPVDQMVWNIQWNYQINNSYYGFNSRVDAVTGDLIDTALYIPNMNSNEAYYPPKLTEEQALDKARVFLQKAVTVPSGVEWEVDDNDAYSLANPSLFGPVEYTFSFRQKKGGIKSNFANYYITVTGDGTVIRFSRPLDPIDLPNTKVTITQAEADQQFADQLDLELAYVPQYKEGLPERYLLAWQPVEAALYDIDAATGARISKLGKEAGEDANVLTDVPAGQKLYTPRSEGERLTDEEAAKLVEQRIGVPANRSLASRRLSQFYPDQDRQVWNLSWRGNDSGTRGLPPETNVMVDADSGQILSYTQEAYRYNDDRTSAEAVKPVPYETAKQKAFYWVNLLYPDASQQLKLAEAAKEPRQAGESGYDFTFARYYKGIKVVDDNVTMHLGPDGDLESYYGRSNPKVSGLPTEPSVDKKAALKVYLNEYQTELHYAYYGGYYSILNQYEEPVIRLVYGAVPKSENELTVALDAQTGKWLTNNQLAGQLAPGQEPADIKGRPEEQDLQTLIRYQVLKPDEEGLIHPEAEITVGDWLDMMARAATTYISSSNNGDDGKPKSTAGVSPEDVYYTSVQYASSAGWIDAKSQIAVHDKLTRDKLAALLAGILQYSKLTVYLKENGEANQFTDAAAIQNKGAVTLAVKLGLLKGTDGRFEPQHLVTKAEAAQVMMKLVKLQGHTDQKIVQSY